MGVELSWEFGDDLDGFFLPSRVGAKAILVLRAAYPFTLNCIWTNRGTTSTVAKNRPALNGIISSLNPVNRIFQAPHTSSTNQRHFNLSPARHDVFGRRHRPCGRVNPIGTHVRSIADLTELFEENSLVGHQVNPRIPEGNL